MEYFDTTAYVMQIVAKNAHFDKIPMNALIAKAVEICEQKRMSYSALWPNTPYGEESPGQLTESRNEMASRRYS